MSDNPSRKRLPQLGQDIVKLLDLTQRELEGLPQAPPEDPTPEIARRVGEFCKHLQGAVYGQGDMRGLVQANRRHYDQFCNEIGRTTPDFRPFEEPENYRRLAYKEDAGKDVSRLPLIVEPLGVLEVRKFINE